MFTLSGARPLLMTGALVTASLTVSTGPALADDETCNGKPATIVVSTPPAESAPVDGTPGDDVIVVTTPNGLTVNGLGGNDTICGAGRTSMTGGEGNDELWVATPNPDAIVVVQGDEGDDVIHGSDSVEFIEGGTGNDTIQGGGGADLIAGDSRVTPATAPASDNDTIDAGPGADTVIDDWGTDTLTGGSDADQLVLGVATSDPVDDGCGQGIDTTATLRVAEGTVTGLGDATFTGFEIYIGGTRNSTLIGSSGPDDLRTGDCGTAHLIGLSGEDRLEGDSNSGGLLSANSGDDKIFYSEPYDIHAGKGDDRIFIESSPRDGRGVRASVARFNALQEVLGNEGTDWIIDNGNRSEIDLRLFQSVENARQKVHPLSKATFRLIGTAGPNVLVGPPGSKKSGQTYRTVLSGRSGNDRLLGGRYDTAYGGQGRDFCHAEHRQGCERR